MATLPEETKICWDCIKKYLETHDSLELDYKGQPMLSLFGKELDIEQKRNTDIITNFKFDIKLPILPEGISWIDDVEFKIIKSFKFIFAGEVILELHQQDFKFNHFNNSKINYTNNIISIPIDYFYNYFPVLYFQFQIIFYKFEIENINNLIKGNKWDIHSVVEIQQNFKYLYLKDQYRKAICHNYEGIGKQLQNHCYINYYLKNITVAIKESKNVEFHSLEIQSDYLEEVNIIKNGNKIISYNKDYLNLLKLLYNINCPSNYYYIYINNFNETEYNINILTSKDNKPTIINKKIIKPILYRNCLFPSNSPLQLITLNK